MQTDELPQETAYPWFGLLPTIHYFIIFSK